MPVPPAGPSSSIDSASSFSSSKSSLLAPPVDEVSSQSDVASDTVTHPMFRTDTAIYGVAASPTHPTSSGFTASVTTVSATQKFKRAFAKRRRPSHDAGSLLSSADERYAPHLAPSSFPSRQLSPGVPNSSSNRPSTAKRTMHLFGARKHHDSPLPDPNQPPPLPPKPSGLRAPRPQTANDASKTSNNPIASRPHSSVMVTSPSITAALEFMREDEERQRVAEQQQAEFAANESRRELEENKENWRKSDSTMDSGHTVRPANNTTESGPAVSSKRMSAMLIAPSGGDLDLIEFLAGTADQERPRPNDPLTGAIQSKRRSRSLNIQVPSSHMTTSSLSAVSLSSLSHSPYPTPPATMDLGSTYSTPSSTSGAGAVTLNPPDMPVIMRTPANGVITSGIASDSPVYKSNNIRGRLAARTNATGPIHRSPSPLAPSAASTSTPLLTTSSMTSLYPPPHRRVVVTSDASNLSPHDMQAIAAVRQMQNRGRSPSASSTSSSAGIRQAATSLTSGAGAMALGLGKRAYEKVGRVWNGSQSGSVSDTPTHRQPSPVNAYSPSGGALAQPLHGTVHAPSAYPPHGRRTPGTSGTWSVSSLGGSRSSSEKDRAVSGPEMSASSASSGLGRLIRPPRNNMGGIVFGKDLWTCVKDTRAMVTSPVRDPLSGRMIPALVYRCAQHIHKWGLEEEGLFRISGRSSHIGRLRNGFDGGADYDLTDCSPSELDPHAVASVFKAYLRELPEPILTRALGPSFEAAVNAENSYSPPSSASGMMSKTIGGVGLPSGPRPMSALRKPPSLSTFTLPTSSSLRAPSSTLIEALSDLIARLPRENRDVLQTVVELMNATAARSVETKMPLSNLLLVFCPSLSMAPTLLRALCDVPSIWEYQPPIMDITRAPSDELTEDSDNSTSVSDSEEDEVILVPASFKGKEKEMSGADTPLSMLRSRSTPEVAEAKTEQIAISVISRSPRAVRRVPVPTLYLDNNDQVEDSYSYMRRSQTLPLLTEPPLYSSAPSLEIPSRSQTPSSSPMHSQVSLNSLSDKPDVVPSPIRQAPSSSQSLVFVQYPPPNHDKSLPASPRSPAPPIVGFRITQEEASTLPDQNEYRSEEFVHKSDSSDGSLPRTPLDVHPERPVSPLGKEIHNSSAPQLQAMKDAHPERSLSLPTPLVVASQSASNVAFPSSAKTAPLTPTSLKKHALTLSLGRNPKPDETDLPSPSKRLARRPSLNMLLNLKRSGSPSPRLRTPTISSPLASPVSPDRASDISPIKPKTLPPVLTLPIVGSMDVGLGWDDVFGSSEETAPAPVHQRTANISQSSAQTLWPQPQPPPSPSHTSSNGLVNSRGPPVVFPSATAVLEAASSSPIMPSPSTGSPPTSMVFQTDSSSSTDRTVGDISTETAPVAEPRSPPPHINFQLRGSSLEDEDWASIVLLAAGKPAESLA